MKFLVLLSVALLSSAWGFPPLTQNNNFGGRIIGGQTTKPYAYPFQCSLQRTSGARTWHTCGSTILNKNYILTAGHCVDTLQGSNDTMTVWCGKWDVTKTEPYEQKVNIKKFIIHQNWTDIPGPYNLPYDIALIELAQPLNFTNTVQPVTLPPKDFNVYARNATIIGWGYYQVDETQEYVLPAQLQYAHVPLIDIRDCEFVVSDWLPSVKNNVCTGPLEGGFGDCNGDSGGAMVQQTKNGFVQIGISSWAIRPCGTPYAPSGYLLPQNFLDWIKENQTK